jgi:benzoate membrane transport protein
MATVRIAAPRHRTVRSLGAMSSLKKYPVVSQAAIAAGLTASLGYTFGSIPLFFGAVSHLGLTPSEQSSWFFIVFLTSAVSSLVLTMHFRLPIPVGWTAPGLVFLATFGNRFSVAELAGAGLVAGLVVLGLGWTGQGERLVRWVPLPIVMGVFAGSVLGYASGIFIQLGTQPWTVGATLAGYIGARSLGRSWLPPMGGVVLAGVAAAILAGQVHFDALPWSPPTVQLIWPSIHPTSLLTLSVPLVVMMLGVGGVQGIGVLEAQGYRPPTRLLVAVMGLNSIVNACFGGHPSSMQVQTAAILASPEAGPAKERYWATLIASSYALLLAFGAGVAGNLIGGVPAPLIASLAGLALMSPVLDALRRSLGSDLSNGAFFAMVIAASPLTVLGISSAFWALIGGLVVSWLIEREAVERWWHPSQAPGE